MSKNRQAIVVEKDKSLGMYLSAGIASLVTLWFQTKTQDPFNVPKFSLLILLAPFTLNVLSTKSSRKVLTNQTKVTLVVLGLFLLSFLLASLFSGNVYQSMVGLYQRNLGFLTYLSFALLFISTCFTLNHKNVNKLLILFIFTGSLETVYGIVQYFGVDPFDWKNPYSPILGTFGNPNFQSAFLGITSAAALGLIINGNWSIRVLLSLQILSSLFLIQVSNSSQGFMSFGVTGTIILLSYLRINRRKFFLPAMGLSLVAFGIAILGILNKGPASFLYQASISARGDYWRAAIAMFKDEPLNGVGIERYGDYFGSFRDLQQVRGRSFATFSDNAHNTFLHFAATGGILLVLTYTFLVALVVVFSFRKLRKSDGVLSLHISIMLGTFLAFIAISLISPENVGFTVWAWVFAGGLIGLSTLVEQPNPSSIPTKNSNRPSKILAIVLTLVLVVPSIMLTRSINTSDREIWQAYGIAYSGSGTLEDLLMKVKKVTEASPREQRYKLLASSMAYGLSQPELSRDYSEQVLEINSRNVDAFVMKAISYEKQANYLDAIKNRKEMLKFDPYNLANLDRIARNLHALGELPEALKYLQTMREIQSENSLVITLSEFLKN
jgi:O-antigen ligase